MRILSAIFLFLLSTVASMSIAQNSSEEGQNLGKYLGAKDTIMPEWFKESFLDFEEDIAEAEANDKRLILYFHQQGCPYCNKLVEDNFADPVIGEKVRGNFDVVMINMWGDREVVQVGGKSFTEKDLAAALNVAFTPTLLFFDEKKKVVLRLDGYYPHEEFNVALDYVSNKMESELDFASYSRQELNPSAEDQAAKSGNLTHENWVTEAPYDLNKLTGKKPIAVLFEEANCQNCKLMHEKTFTDLAAKEILAQYEILQVNRWDRQSSVTLLDGRTITPYDWANALEISYAPTIVLLDTDGKEVLKVGAMFKTFHILGSLEYVASSAYLEEPSLQRYLSARAEHIREQGVDVNIWKY